jgi:hypothetical protein
MNQKGKNNNNFKDGRTLKIYKCIVCNKKIQWHAYVYGTKKCKSCAHITNNLPHCIDCGKKLTKYNCIRCKSCENKIHPRNLIHGLPLIKKYCMDCGKKITWWAKRCKKCSNIKKCLDGNIGHHGKHLIYKRFYFKSSWEETYAKYLDKNNLRWTYEPKTFDLGNTTYTPDFYVPIYAAYIEIKGFWRDDAKKKFKLFRKLYPDIRIRVLTKKSLQKLGIL